MSTPMSRALPRQIISLVSVLLVVFLVAFPSSSAIVATLVLLGGGAFLLQSRAGQTVEEVQMQPLEDARRMAAALKSEPVNSLGTASTASVASSQNQSQANGVPGSTGEQQLSRQSADIKIPPAPGSRPGKARDRTISQDTLPDSLPKESSSAKKEAEAPMERQEPPTSQLDRKREPPKANGSPAPLAGGAAVLARLRQQRANAKRQNDAATKELLIAYASQTGTAQEIAKGIQAESAAHGVKSKVSSLNELGFEVLTGKKDAILVIVASSTGDGDAPDNAAKFYATIRRKTQAADALSGLKFTCLGLGDSNYTRFMGVSRALRSRMQELGAQPFYKMGEADEVDGLESVVDAWIAGLWEPLKAAAGNQKASSTSTNGTTETGKDKDVVPPKLATEGLEGVPALSTCQISIRWRGDAAESTSDLDGKALLSSLDHDEGDGDQPVTVPIQSARFLTAPTAEKQVMHVELGLRESSIHYQPGDSVSLLPVNETSLVNKLQVRLGVEGTATFDILSLEGEQLAAGLSHIPRPSTVHEALQRCDISSAPRKSMLRTLAEHCSDKGDKQELLRLSSRGGRQDYACLITPVSPTLLDLLRRYPSCHPPWADLIYALPPLAPRLYSISSSPLESPDSLDIALTVVKIGDPKPNLPDDRMSKEAAGGVTLNGGMNGHSDPQKTLQPRWGVASGWLERKAEPLLRNTSGKAQVQVRLKKGGTFGHPSDLSAPLLMIGPGTGVAPFRGFLQHSRKEDFLYGQELEDFVKDGTLSHLELAFSRDTEQKVYVQHLMKQQGERVASILNDPKSYVFICGDGAHMAKDVNSTLLSILEEHSNLSSAEATARLADMTKTGRYVRDIWS